MSELGEVGKEGKVGKVGEMGEVGETRGVGKMGEVVEVGGVGGVSEMGEVGVGPFEGAWPDDNRFDPELLAQGDRRNVLDKYRYWSVEAISADLDARRHPFHVAVENWEHDRNIGTVVRTANAFLAARVHIVGRRRWNRRAAMMTDVYQHIDHHSTVEGLVAWASAERLPVIGIDNFAGSVPLEGASLPRECVMLFGQEGPGLSALAREASSVVYSIAQYGSTRSLNAGVAAGIAMHAWVRQWAGRNGEKGERDSDGGVAS